MNDSPRYWLTPDRFAELLAEAHESLARAKKNLPESARGRREPLRPVLRTPNETEESAS